MGYGIQIKVSAEYGLFSRPEMKVERMSYEIITPSSARGILEAVYWKPAIRWVIDKITVLKPIAFTNIRRNEVSEKAIAPSQRELIRRPSRPLFISATETRQQRAATVLREPAYLIDAHFEIVPEKAGQNDTPEKHYNVILRRLRKGQHFMQPCMGTREFAANVELVEENNSYTSPLKGEKDLGWMLYDLDFSDPENITPFFFRAVLEDGVLDLGKVDRWVQ